MASIHDYLRLSPSAEKVIEVYANPDDFQKTYWSVSELELSSILRHYIVNNVPFAFSGFPILH
jgi:hypothetical protein